MSEAARPRGTGLFDLGGKVALVTGGWLTCKRLLGVDAAHRAAHSWQA